MTVTIGNQLYVPYDEVSLTQRVLLISGRNDTTLLSTMRLASSPGHSQILSCSRGEKLGEGLGSLPHHRAGNGGLG